MKSGDPAAYEDFSKEYLPLIIRTLDRHSYSDIVQDFHESIISYSLDQSYNYISNNTVLSPAGIVYRITRRLISRYFEKSRKIKHTNILDVNEPNIADNNKNAEDNIIDRENQNIRQEYFDYQKFCLERLTNTQKLVISLWQKGNSWADIARLREVTESAINQVKKAAFRFLKECINELRRV